MNNKPTQGGKRSGAGRPAKADKKRTVSLKLSVETAEFLASLPKMQRADWVESAINQFRTR